MSGGEHAALRWITSAAQFRLEIEEDRVPVRLHSHSHRNTAAVEPHDAMGQRRIDAIGAHRHRAPGNRQGRCLICHDLRRLNPTGGDVKDAMRGGEGRRPRI
jgi:hypothetical protein